MCAPPPAACRMPRAGLRTPPAATSATPPLRWVPAGAVELWLGRCWGRLLQCIILLSTMHSHMILLSNPRPLLQGGVGARTPISLAQCAVACQGAKGCEAFTYNSVQQGCFLKAGQCPLRNNCQVGRSGGLLGTRSEAVAVAVAPPPCLPSCPLLPCCLLVCLPRSPPPPPASLPPAPLPPCSPPT